MKNDTVQQISQEETMDHAVFRNVDCISMYVPDLDAGIAFYSQKLGLRLLWRADDSCGLGLPDDITEVVLCVRKNQMVDFRVESVEEALKDFTAAGGTCVYGPFDINIGKCAVVRDPWNNEFCILDMSKGTYDTDSNGNVTGVTKKN